MKGTLVLQVAEEVCGMEKIEQRRGQMWNYEVKAPIAESVKKRFVEKLMEL